MILYARKSNHRKLIPQFALIYQLAIWVNVLVQLVIYNRYLLFRQTHIHTFIHFTENYATYYLLTVLMRHFPALLKSYHEVTYVLEPVIVRAVNGFTNQETKTAALGTLYLLISLIPQAFYPFFIPLGKYWMVAVSVVWLGSHTLDVFVLAQKPCPTAYSDITSQLNPQDAQFVKDNCHSFEAIRDYKPIRYYIHFIN